MTLDLFRLNPKIANLPLSYLNCAKRRFGSEVDIKSEVCRCCGGLRFTLYALKMIWCSCTTFNATLHYLPRQVGKTDTGSMGDLETGSAKVTIDMGGDLNLQNDLLPSLSQEIGEYERQKGWKTLDLSRNQFFMATQMPMLEAEMKMSPKSTLHDGTVNIQIVDHASPCMFTKLLLDLETGDHLIGNTVREIECVALRLEPKDGMVVVDGELVEREPIQLQIHQGALRAFCL